jgi:hypothetical protein
MTKDSFYNDLESHRIVKVGTTVVWEGPLSVREVLLSEGFSSLPVWISETGKTASPGNAAEEEAQRKCVERVLAAMQARSQWWHRTFFYGSRRSIRTECGRCEVGFALRVADRTRPTGQFPEKEGIRLPVGVHRRGAGGSGGGGGSQGRVERAGAGGDGGPGRRQRSRRHGVGRQRRVERGRRERER